MENRKYIHDRSLIRRIIARHAIGITLTLTVVPHKFVIRNKSPS